MSEGTIRINKVLKDFNIGTGTLADFFKKKNINIEVRPTEKISEEVYELVAKEFGKEQLIKEQSRKVTINIKEMTSMDHRKDALDEREAVHEVIIKTNVLNADSRTVRKPEAESPKVKADDVHAASGSEGQKAPGLKILGHIDVNAHKQGGKTVGKASEAGNPSDAVNTEVVSSSAAGESRSSGDGVASDVKREEVRPDGQSVIDSERPDNKVETSAGKSAVSGGASAEGQGVSAEGNKESREELSPVADEKRSADQNGAMSQGAPIHTSTDGKGSVAAAADNDRADAKEEHVISGNVSESVNSQNALNSQSVQNSQNSQNVQGVQGAQNSQNAVKTSQSSDSSDSSLAAGVSEQGKSADGKPADGKPVIEHIGINVEKLAGPKINGTMDLSQFEKKPHDKDARKDKGKGRRERIAKPGATRINVEEIKDAGQGSQRGSGNGTGGSRSGRGDSNGGTNNGGGRRDNRQKAGQGNRGQDNQRGGRGSKKDRFKAIRTEIDEDEVQKQIKETYARMVEGKGKTKTSKHRREKREGVSNRLHEEMELQEQTSNILKVTEFVTVNELAILMDNTPVTKVIEACMNLGLMVSINQRLDAEALVLVAEEFGYKIEFVTAEIQGAIEQEEDREEDLVPRPPIVTVMGHVDHGKTSLLDYIRKANVIAGEAGGITQHIGAYNVELPDGRRITFLDTPGHEAFTAMRARGAKVTDLAIIIVAADDAVMPQTIEAINHAQAAGVPMIFAINKIDKPGANPEKIKEQLANMNILVEDWGGKYQCQEISAKKGINVDLLLEKVLLEADLLELKANPDKLAVGNIIESSLDKGRGYLATVLVQAGTLHVGDAVVAGSYSGRIKAMFNERGQKLKEAGPSTPVSILGLNGAPTAGDTLNAMEDEKEARDIANKREQLIRIQGIKTQTHITLEEIGRRIALGNFQELNIIVKADVDGSIEALSDSLIKLSTEEIHVNVIHKAVGAISESDVLLAVASNAIIIGFQVRPMASARKLAEKEQIEIRLYSVIYDAIEEVKSGIEGMLAPEQKEEVTATAEVRETFKISKVGTIAGCMVKEGKLTRSSKIRVIRDGIVIHTGSLGSLKRFKDDVKEVAAGFDCGLNIESFNDVLINDVIEAYQIVEIKRKL